MTAAVAPTPRPVLYLVPGSDRTPAGRSPGPASGAPPASSSSGRAATPLPSLAAELAAVVLGTVFVPVATRVAARFAAQAPLLARRGDPEPWAAAIVFLLAQESRLFDYDPATTRTSLARELQLTLSTLRRRVRLLHTSLGDFDLDLPDPDPELA